MIGNVQVRHYRQLIHEVLFPRFSCFASGRANRQIENKFTLNIKSNSSPLYFTSEIVRSSTVICSAFSSRSFSLRTNAALVKTILSSSLKAMLCQLKCLYHANVCIWNFIDIWWFMFKVSPFTVFSIFLFSKCRFASSLSTSILFSSNTFFFKWILRPVSQVLWDTESETRCVLFHNTVIIWQLRSSRELILV